MDEILAMLLAAAIGAISSILGTAAMLKLLARKAVINGFYDIVQVVRDDTDVQKTLYGIGTLFGNAIITGTGLKRSGSTKFRLEDLIMQGAGIFMQKAMGGKQQSVENTETFKNPLQL